MRIRSFRRFKNFKQYLKFKSIMTDPEWKAYRMGHRYTTKFVSTYNNRNDTYISSIFDRSWKTRTKRVRQYK